MVNINKNEKFADGYEMIYFPPMNSPPEPQDDAAEQYVDENSSEASIARRLSFARKGLRLSQREIAEKVGITRERWASYEYGRAPLKFDAGIRFCKTYNINEAWLATGNWYMHPYLDLCTKKVIDKVPLGTVFSVALQQFLSSHVEKAYSKKIDETEGRFCFDSPDDYASADNFLRFLAESWIHQIPNQHKSDFVNYVFRSAESFLNQKSIPYKPMPIDIMLKIRSKLNTDDK